jgi:hypothetical protein
MNEFGKPQTGKLSMEWKAEEQTKVLGTYPPMGRPAPKWTGYVEKDTAGQTNIYAVEVSRIAKPEIFLYTVSSSIPSIQVFSLENPSRTLIKLVEVGVVMGTCSSPNVHTGTLMPQRLPLPSVLYELL